MEEGIKGEKQREQAYNIPVEIEMEILHRLPPKSLVRFMCASKLWHDSIKHILRRRLSEEFNRRLRKVLDAHQSVIGLYLERPVLARVDKLLAARVRVKAKTDEMMKALDFDDDTDHYFNLFPSLCNRFRKLREDDVNDVGRCVNCVLRHIDRLIDAAIALQEEGADALN